MDTVKPTKITSLVLCEKKYGRSPIEVCWDKIRLMLYLLDIKIEHYGLIKEELKEGE